MVKTAPGRHDGECLHCQGLGLIFPVKPRAVRVRFKLPDGTFREFVPVEPARALPLPCMFCQAGGIEARVWDDLERKGVNGAELEIRAFRKAKG